MRLFEKLFHKKAVSATAPAQNREGYPAWRRSLEEQFLQVVTTNTMGGAFYADRKTLLDESMELHDKMLATDSKLAADILVYARNQGFLRAQPVVGLAKLASVDPAEFRRIFDEIVRTPNDLIDFTTVIRALRGNGGGRAVKSAAGRWLAGHLGEYQAIKYGGDRKDGYSLRDLIRIYHPDHGGQRSAVVDWLVGPSTKRPERGADLTHLPQVAALEALKGATSDDDKVRYIREGRLPVEVASSFAGRSKAVWEAIVPQMPIFALTRHLATLERHGVLEAVRDTVVAKLSNPQAVAKSKMFPYRFVEASRHVRDARVRDALRDAVDLSFAAVPDLVGRTVVMLDISGSMGAYVQQAALFAICALKKAHGNGRLLCYDTDVDEVAVSMRDSVLTQAERISVRGGTDTGRPMRQVLGERYQADNVLLITDEQQNTGAPFVDAFVQYRERVAPRCKLFVLDVAPYREAIVPAMPEAYFMYGWSDAALRFVAMASQGWGSLVEFVRAGGKPEPPPEGMN